MTERSRRPRIEARGCLWAVGFAVLAVGVAFVGMTADYMLNPPQTGVPTARVEAAPAAAAAVDTPAAADAFGALIAEALGDGNRAVERVEFARVGDDGRVHVGWAINSAWPESQIKENARRDVVNILRAIHEAGIEYVDVRLRATFPMVDAYGNTSEDRVLTLEYDRETVEAVRWDNDPFVRGRLLETIYAIADKDDVEPAFLR